MLNRFRDLVKRLELPSEEEEAVVYRIIDDDFNAVEVTPAQYGIWRMQNDVLQKAIVGQDTVEDVVVRTTFSIMPEHRRYKPFGTSAYALPVYDPLPNYSRRYDTWREAERGHRATLESIRQHHAEIQAAAIADAAHAGTAGEVMAAIQGSLPDLFQISALADNEALVYTPLMRVDGSSVELTVTADDNGYTLTIGAGGGDSPHYAELLRTLGISAGHGVLTCKANDARQLADSVIALSQAVACLSFMLGENP